MQKLFKNSLIFIFAATSLNALSVPVDWKGSLSFDTTIIKDFRRTGDNCDATKNGKCIKAQENNARFQNMTLTLNPDIIVNDSVTIVGELSTGNSSTGSNRSQNMGSGTTLDSSGGAYFSQTTSSSLDVNQMYANIYADTALYRVGRFSKDFGLGAVINGGHDPADKFFSGYEGLDAKLKIKDFKLDLMWAKLHTSSNPNGRYDAYESSITALYDSAVKNMQFGIYYGLREAQSDSTLYGASAGAQKVTIIDVFFSKEWEKFSFGLEIPMLSGEVANAYNTGNSDFDTNAYVLETKYQVNSKWNVGVNAGMVKGDDGETTNFEGMYLHPNYQLAEVMFKYNYHGFTDATNYNVFNSSIVNTTYAQLFAHYKKGEWGWRLSTLWAKADKTAEKGKSFYNHAKKVKATATQDQSDDLGYEFDAAFDYQWNPSVVFTGFLGYHFVGKFYEFSNDTSTISTSNVMSSGMKLAIKF